MLNIRLKRARKAAGLSLRNLGALVGLSQTMIKKYEDGVVFPSSDILIRLSRALKVRTEYFFRPEKPFEGVEYRKRSSLSKKRLEAIKYEVTDQIERRFELEALFPQPPLKDFAIVEGLPDLITEMDQIEEVSECVRKAWNIGLDPIPDLIGTLETNGIRVFVIHADADSKFDGLAGCIDAKPIVVVGRHWPGDRQRFTLAHEVGHLMLKDRISKDLDEEKACNRFAGAFLFPRPFVLQELGNCRHAIELNELGLLKEEFGLSMAGILFRALNLKIISPSYHKEQFKLFSRTGWKRKEPGLDYPPEKAHIFEQLLFHALAEDYIGESKAAELMNVSLEQFRRIRSMEGSNAAINQ